MISVKDSLNDYLYAQNTNARKKQEIWRKKQENIFYNSGRPIYSQKKNQTTFYRPTNLWYLHEDKYRYNYQSFSI
tara:strand:- start:2835 stop:3059 length:225 start_codon:yes stop_codon:yes gene_type:complete